jgi:hypothetical protein
MERPQGPARGDPPRTPPGREERLRTGLLTMGGWGLGFELAGAMRGGSGGQELGTAGLLLTLLSAATFAVALLVALGLARWRRP